MFGHAIYHTTDFPIIWMRFLSVMLIYKKEYSTQNPKFCSWISKNPHPHFFKSSKTTGFPIKITWFRQISSAKKSEDSNKIPKIAFRDTRFFATHLAKKYLVLKIHKISKHRDMSKIYQCQSWNQSKISFSKNYLRPL